jgi:NADH:ubiquinone oxidoreductase subunit 6 (subunit J)
MTHLLDYPLLVFVLSFFTLCLSAAIGALFRRKRDVEKTRENYSVIVAATLTLLALIIGFSFSMATNRYDQRKNYEEAEANAIGTEYLRADFLPAADAARIRALLRKYTDQRVLFYTTRDTQRVAQIDADTARLQAELWSVVRESAESRPAPVVVLVASGMNDVLNSQGYTQAAWWNRIPIAAWSLMVLIAICCTLLAGFGVKDMKAERILIPILPLVVSIAFFLTADIDSPRAGVIRVSPQNLISLSESLRAH